MAPTGRMHDSATTREFSIPVSQDALRRLQGAACIVCGEVARQLYPAGHAVSVSPCGQVLRWNVRACAPHTEAG
ncbi:hypothetical protein [Streptomyces sp. H27-D2]|uniref:hypothetical protein n=1 Tax=Streptomyces sp. H27-D2 TaxID=3046304 RepID=UPI002DB73D75|nr:hypothetical protein [Streptomyces sp. H27-D2]MEC4018383.1 hypothetical protein [Streptomyces sp. H27-D2]